MVSLEPQFVGLANFREMFAREEFYRYLSNSVIVVIGVNALNFGLGLGTALIANEDFRGKSIVRGLMIIPWITPVVVVGVIWRFIYDPSWGVLNKILFAMHLVSREVYWLGEPELVWFSVIIAKSWMLFPFFYICYLAALQVIPQELYDASKIDGAGSIDRFRYITFQWLKFPIVITLLLNTVWAWNHFAAVWLLTGGGPGDRTVILPIEVYKQSFLNWRFGYAASIGTFMLVCMIIFTIIYLRMTFKEE